MKKNIVIGFVVVAAVVGLFLIPAKVATAADSFSVSVGYQVPVKSGIGSAYATITNSTACTFTDGVIDASGGKEVALHYQSILDGAGTAAQSIVLEASGDKSNWVAYKTLSLAGNGNNIVGMVTNITVLGTPYLRVKSLTNAEATSKITNYFIKAFVKQ